MRCRAEACEWVAVSETREALEAFVIAETVEPYVDDGTQRIVHDTDAIARHAGAIVIDPPRPHGWHKTFRQGGPLEWFNPARDIYNGGSCYVDIGDSSTWAERARADFCDFIYRMKRV
jgi:hypothetical protein